MSMTRRDALASGTAFAATALASNVASAAPYWEARSNMDAAAYQAKFDQMTAAGFRPVVVDGYDAGGQVQFAAIWRKTGGPAWVARHGLDSAGYQQAFDQFTSQGFRPRRVSVYQDKGVRYAAIWDKSNGPAWIARHGLNTNQFQAEFDKNAAAGYRLVNIGASGFFIGGPTYAGIWEKSDGVAWEARSGLNANQYQAKFNQMTAQGFRLRQACGYNVFTTQAFCAIWDKRPSPAWEAHHNLTTAKFQQKFNDMNAQGFWLTDVSGYDLGGQPGFAGIWEKAP
jgi:hypothetical protein